MRDQIIQASIESMKEEGLRFSVDLLAGKLKISKKTVYKYFPDKEALAVALYEKVFSDAMEQAKVLMGQGTKAARKALLRLYFDIKWMTRGEVFNKYKLNQTIYALTSERVDALWNVFCSALGREALGADRETLRVVIDGSFEKLCSIGKETDLVDLVIERLADLL